MEDLSELLKYKELLDKNIITQEEFEKKKSELLKSGVLNNNSSQTMFKNSNKKIKVKKISVGKSILYILLFLIVLGIIISTMIGKNNTITLIDGQAGKYGVYDENNVGYIYYLPVGTYKIISYKDTDMAIDLFDAIVWKSDDTSYSLKGKKYRKSASDEKTYITELPDTFSISEKEYIYIPMGWTITLEIIKN